MSKRILLTGANGFIGTHILSLLLDAGYSVRCTVRSASKATSISSTFPSVPSSHLDCAIVPDITVPGAYKQALQSSPPFTHVIHTASPYLYRAISSNLEFLDPALKGTLELLKAVKEVAGESVQRVVLTSSCAAVLNFGANAVSTPKKVYTEEDWNPRTWEEALNGTPGAAYQASKKFSELAAWDFIKTENPNFDLVTLTPPMVYGPMKHPVASVADLNESTGRIYNNFINSTSDAPLPPNGLHLYTDVRDLAQAHLLALTSPQASNQRFIICSPGKISSQEISDILRKNIPELKSRTPIGVPGQAIEEGLFEASSEKAVELLGVTFRSKEETFVELGKQLVEIEGREK